MWFNAEYTSHMYTGKKRAIQIVPQKVMNNIRGINVLKSSTLLPFWCH